MAQVFLENIAADKFTEKTIRRMFELVNSAKTDAKFQDLAYSIINNSMRGQWRDYEREAGVLLNWVRSHVDYRRDPYDVELVQDVWSTLSRKRADCDDFVVLLGAMLEVSGTPVRFITVSTSPDKEPGHVYLEANFGGRWTPLDAIIQGAPVGWSPTDGITDRRVWTRSSVGLSGGDDPPMGGLGMSDQSDPSGWTYDGYSSNGHQPRWEGRNWEGGFATRMFQVPPPPGYTEAGSQTWAAGESGEIYIERTPSQYPSLIAPTADQRETEKAGGGIYAEHYPIISNPSISERRTVIERQDVPLVFNPDLWTGAVPDAVSESVYELPGPVVPDDQALADLAGLGNVRNVDHETRKALRDEYCRCFKSCCEEYQKRGKAMSGLSGLGNVIDDLVNIGKNLLTSGAAPTAADAANLAVDAYDEYKAVQAAEAAKERAAQDAAAKAAAARQAALNALAASRPVALGIGTMALIAAGALILLKATKRNPGRRYRRNHLPLMGA